MRRNGFAVAILAAGFVLAGSTVAFGQGIPDKSYQSWSPMPILMYDNDIGMGYGGKIKFVDFLAKKESFDLILFNSTKGERWYVFTFSLPDTEIRQGKTYPFAFDFKFDVTAAYSLRWLNYSRVEDGETFTDFLRQRTSQFVPFLSLIVRYDTSESQIHPTRGVRFLLQDDIAGGIVGSRDSSYNRITLDLRQYTRVFGEKDVFAARALVQYITGSEIPVFDMSSLGGGGELSAMRGYALNRFLDKGKFLANFEYRFPIFWRFGGNLFVDMGTVWPSLDRFSFRNLAIDYGLGLRFYLDDFCVRVDYGFSKEGSRLYFNFGHIF